MITIYDKYADFTNSMYNFLYNDIEDITKGLNLCKFDETGLCIRERTVKDRKPKPYCCCGPTYTASEGVCKNFVEGKGCSVRSIACKMWFCECVEIPKDIQEKLTKLKTLADTLGFYTFRGTFVDTKVCKVVDSLNK